MWRADSFEKTWCYQKLMAGGKGEDRGWDGCMALLTELTWIWVNSCSWWSTERPGMLWFMGSQGVGHNWVTDLNWTDIQDWPDLWRCSLLTYKATTGWQFQGLQWQQFQLGPRHYSLPIFHVALVCFQFIVDGYRMGAPTLGYHVLALFPGRMIPKSFFLRDLFILQVKASSDGLLLTNLWPELCPPQDHTWGGGRTMPLSLWSRHLCFQAGEWRGLSAGLTLSDICHTSYTCFPPCLPSPPMTYL